VPQKLLNVSLALQQLQTPLQTLELYHKHASFARAAQLD
jgi:hypothetical protein